MRQWHGRLSSDAVAISCCGMHGTQLNEAESHQRDNTRSQIRISKSSIAAMSSMNRRVLAGKASMVVLAMVEVLMTVCLTALSVPYRNQPCERTAFVQQYIASDSAQAFTASAALACTSTMTAQQMLVGPPVSGTASHNQKCNISCSTDALQEQTAAAHSE